MGIDAMPLRRDLARIAPQATHAGRRFFAHLQRLDAPLAGRVPTASRAALLPELLQALCDGADDAHAARRACLRLGRAHAAIGVREADYDALGTALLITLHELLGDTFAGSTEDAWAAAYGALAEGIIAASLPAAPG